MAALIAAAVSLASLVAMAEHPCIQTRRNRASFLLSEIFNARGGKKTVNTGDGRRDDCDLNLENSKCEKSRAVKKLQ